MIKRQLDPFQTNIDPENYGLDELGICDGGPDYVWLSNRLPDDGWHSKNDFVGPAQAVDGGIPLETLTADGMVGIYRKAD